VNGWLPLILAALVLFTMMVDHNNRAETQIVLKKDQWRCVEYAPGAADCTVYRKVGTRAEDVQ
jgi:hypothetical protein